MTRDNIVKWAQDAGVMPPGCDATEDQWQSLELFTALVLTAERRRQAHGAAYWTAYEYDVAAEEREECAKICGRIADSVSYELSTSAMKCYEAIRARGVGMTQDEKDVLQNALDEAMVEIRGRNS
tara:strand:+ start:7731 stop:8105 length:375 start_codon:yes stop_codon:yes gene_type:complete